jgi:hypothetical protein
MVDTKSTVSNRKHTLLHYLTELLPKKFPDVVGFQQELSHVEDGAKSKKANDIPSIHKKEEKKKRKLTKDLHLPRL